MEPTGRLSSRTEQETKCTVDTDELLDLLGDEYTRRVVEALIDEGHTGRELIDVTGDSRATVYRRINDLQELGLIRTTQQLDPNGHHRKVFHLAVNELSVSVGDTQLVSNVVIEESQETDGITDIAPREMVSGD